MHAARSRDDDATFPQADTLDETADACARALDPTQARARREARRELERPEVEQDLCLVEKPLPALARSRCFERRQRMIRGVPRRREEVAFVHDLEPLVRCADDVDELVLERARDHDTHAQDRRAPVSGRSVKRPASEPPSTSSTAPETCAAASEQRNMTACAMSSGRPARPSGIDATSDARRTSPARSGNASLQPRTSMYPGETTLTRIPRGPSSIAATFESVSSAAFDAEYAAPSGRGLRTDPVVMLTMLAPSRSRPDT